MQQNKLIRIILVFSIVFMRGYLNLDAQQVESTIRISVSPDHVDWVYKIGEPVKFRVTITRNSEPLTNVKIWYEAGPELMKAEIVDSTIIKDDYYIINGGCMNVPGFLRCVVYTEFEGKRYQDLTTAGYEPDLIKPTTNMPADFDEFWEKSKSEAAKIPMDIELTSLPDRCTEEVNVYHARIQSYKDACYVYGILCIPKKPGKYPALLKIPGAGVRGGERRLKNATYPAEKGMITFDMDVHGIPLTYDGDIYKNLFHSALWAYEYINMDDRDRFYFKRVIMGCIRSIDFIFSLPEFDGVNLAVTGGSQGGALTIATAGLDSRVKYLAAFYPGFCDISGWYYQRAGGWPWIFREGNTLVNADLRYLETSKYYDAVNFAQRIEAQGWYSWGWNDGVCPPTSTHSFYNTLIAPKELFLDKEQGHGRSEEQVRKCDQWLFEKLLGNKSK